MIKLEKLLIHDLDVEPSYDQIDLKLYCKDRLDRRSHSAFKTSILIITFYMLYVVH